MTARNKLLAAPPYPVEQTLKRLGANLRTARLRRHLTIEDLAEKIGTGVRAVADAEHGKASASVNQDVGPFADLRRGQIGEPAIAGARRSRVRCTRRGTASVATIAASEERCNRPPCPPRRRPGSETFPKVTALTRRFFGAR